jgi:hypothetical protein
MIVAFDCMLQLLRADVNIITVDVYRLTLQACEQLFTGGRVFACTWPWFGFCEPMFDWSVHPKTREKLDT